MIFVVVRARTYDLGDEVGFLHRKFRLVPVQHGQCLIAFRLKAAIRSRTYQTARMAVSPLKRKAFQEAVGTVMQQLSTAVLRAIELFLSSHPVSGAQQGDFAVTFPSNLCHRNKHSLLGFHQNRC
jgi:hypothetical protein